LKKVTVPAGVPPVAAVTVAVIVRVCPAVNEVADEASVVFADAMVIVNVPLVPVAAA
jgi:hypothetical protein